MTQIFAMQLNYSFLCLKEDSHWLRVATSVFSKFLFRGKRGVLQARLPLGKLPVLLEDRVSLRGPLGLTNAGGSTRNPESTEDVRGKRGSHLGSEMQPEQSHLEQLSEELWVLLIWWSGAAAGSRGLSGADGTQRCSLGLDCIFSAQSRFSPWARCEVRQAFSCTGNL